MNETLPVLQALRNFKSILAGNDERIKEEARQFGAVEKLADLVVRIPSNEALQHAFFSLYILAKGSEETKVITHTYMATVCRIGAH